MLTANHKFNQRVLPLGVVVVLGMIGVGLVAFFASDLVDFFGNTSASAAQQTDFYQTPITGAP